MYVAWYQRRSQLGFADLCIFQLAPSLHYITLHCISYAMTRLEEYIGNQRATGSHRIFHYESSLKDLHNSKVIRRS